MLAGPASADRVVYDDNLAQGWSSASWGGEFDFAADDLVHAGHRAISARIEPWGGFSIRSDGPFGGAAAIHFWVLGDQPPLFVRVHSDQDGTRSEAVALDHLANVSSGAWAEILFPLSDLGDHQWSRIELIDATGSGVELRIDSMRIVESLPSQQGFTNAEPAGPARVVVYGQGDIGAVKVSSNGVPIEVLGHHAAADPDRTFVYLAQTIQPGVLEIETAGGKRFRRLVRKERLRVAHESSHRISPLIYGMAFPDGGLYNVQHGVTVARWGGNATSTYNPFEGATNRAKDWYFENSEEQSAAEWVRKMEDDGALAALSIPILDWVSKDTTSYSYSVDKYGWQESTDPWKPDAGNGKTPEGWPLEGTDPNDAYEPWSPERTREWLQSFSTPPSLVMIGNELDIAQQTHRDVHPQPVTYQEQLDRFMTWGRMVKETMPNALIAGPASCCWHYYWNSEAGEEDRQAHGGQEFLPWWLDQVAAADAKDQIRTLDYLDIHYYPEGVFNDDTDPETRARRLRMTRSLWDPTYTDESWIADAPHDAPNQPEPTKVMLIPRMRTLLDRHYPGTRLAINEWNFGAETDMSGGLAVADVLGIFARERVDWASYWTTPPAGTPAAAAFQLYRQYDAPFGDEYLPVTTPDPDKLGVYAARGPDGRTTVVVVNKSTDEDVLLVLDDVAPGAARVRRLSAVGHGQLINEPPVDFRGHVLVPAYSAAFFAIRPGAVVDDPELSAPPPTFEPEAPEGGCGSRGQAAPMGSVLLLSLLGLWLRRRREESRRGFVRVRARRR